MKSVSPVSYTHLDVYKRQESILATVHRVLDEFDVQDAVVRLNDKGAIDIVIMSRMQAAICRAAAIAYDWAKEDPHGQH